MTAPCQDCAGVDFTPHLEWDGSAFRTGSLRCSRCGAIARDAEPTEDSGLPEPTGDDPGTGDAVAELIAGNALAASARIGTIEDVRLLRAAYERESRKGVRTAIEERLQELAG